MCHVTSGHYLLLQMPIFKQSGIPAASCFLTQPKASEILAEPARRGSPLQFNEVAKVSQDSLPAFVIPFPVLLNFLFPLLVVIWVVVPAAWSISRMVVVVVVVEVKQLFMVHNWNDMISLLSLSFMVFVSNSSSLMFFWAHCCSMQRSFGSSPVMVISGVVLVVGMAVLYTVIVAGSKSVGICLSITVHCLASCFFCFWAIFQLVLQISSIVKICENLRLGAVRVRDEN